MNARFEHLKISPFEDSRGQLKKTVKKSMLSIEEEIQEVYVLYSNKDTIRGNHYHLKTIEFFTVIAGEAKFTVSDIDKRNIDTFTIKASDNITLKVYPFTVHAIKNESETPLIVLAVSLKEYYPQDSDTLSCNVCE